jgi:molecular chaperone GrpE
MPKSHSNHPDATDNDASAMPDANEHPPELLTHPAYEELMRKLDEAEQKAQQHWDRILRMQAEMENANRRVERDVANAHKYALEKFSNELLPVVDSLELCVKSVPPGANEQAEAVIQGVELTLKILHGALEKAGIQQVDPLSQPFDPEHQQAISMQADDNVPPGTVLSVLQKGYTLNGRLLRPALVVVSKKQD